MPSDSVPSDKIAVGRLLKPFGIHGACAVEPYGATLSKIEVPASVFVGIDEEHCSEKVMEGIEVRQRGVVCSFSDIHDSDSAGSLRGFLLFVERSALPPLDKGCYYHFELRGLRVQTDRGLEVGTVENVHNFPTVDTIEVIRLSGERVMIPLSEEAVLDVDQTSGYMTLRHDFVDDLIQ